MNRFHWTYVDSTGRKNQIGIVHFPQKSGHLLIYINKKISTVDFKIFESKTYTFFIEGEMCEISVEKKGDQYFYGFDINKEADTPHNRMRKERDRKHFWQTMLLIAGLAAIIGAVIFFNTRKNTQHYQKEALSLTATNSIAVPSKLFWEGNDVSVSYSFVADNQVIERTTSKAVLATAATALGLSIDNGAEFMLLYAPHNPQIHRLDWTQPSPFQIQKYIEQAIQKEMKIQTGNDSTQVACHVQMAYQLHGLPALAHYLHQDIPISQNPQFNSDAYKRMVRAVPFQKAIEKDCFE